MVEEKLSLRDLNEISRKEKNSRVLLSIPKDFYTQCQYYVSDLEEELKEEEKSGGQSPKAMMLREELGKAQSKIANIFSFRQRKILLLVHNKSAGAGRDLDIENLTEEERLFFDEALAITTESRKTILGSAPLKKKRLRTLFSRRSKKEEEDEKTEARDAKAESKGTVVKSAGAEIEPESGQSKLGEDQKKPAPSTETSSPDQDDEEPIVEDTTTVVVLVDDIPPLMGPKTIYELSAQDVASLPTPMALLLEKEGKVKRIDA